MKIVMAKMATDLLQDPQGFVRHPGGSATSASRLVSRDEGSLRAFALTPHADDSDPARRGGLAQAVADACVRKLAHRAHTTGGLILLDRKGHPAAAFNTPRMAYGYVEASGTFRIAP
jgi:hypothetical protein